jgi:hypothetical protein
MIPTFWRNMLFTYSGQKMEIYVFSHGTSQETDKEDAHG